MPKTFELYCDYQPSNQRPHNISLKIPSLIVKQHSIHMQDFQVSVQELFY